VPERKKLKEKYRFKVVLGGSGAWQFSFKKEDCDDYGIDHVVIGEVDDKIVDIYEDILTGDAPDILYIMTDRIKMIPYIEGPTTNGCVEAMRGCGRGCEACRQCLHRLIFH